MKRSIELMKQEFCPSSKKLGEYASIGKENITDSTEREAFEIHLGYCSACQEGYKHLRDVFQQTRDSFPQYPKGTITDAGRWRNFLNVLNAPYQFYYIPELSPVSPSDKDYAFVNRLEKRFEEIDDQTDKLFINIGLYHSVHTNDLALSNFREEIEAYTQVEIPKSSEVMNRDHVMNRDIRLHYLIGKMYLGAGRPEETMDWLNKAYEFIQNHLYSCIKCQKWQFETILNMYTQMWVSDIREVLPSNTLANIVGTVRTLSIAIAAGAINTRQLFVQVKSGIINPIWMFFSNADIQSAPFINQPLVRLIITAIQSSPFTNQALGAQALGAEDISSDDDLQEPLIKFLEYIDRLEEQQG